MSSGIRARSEPTEIDWGRLRTASHHQLVALPPTPRIERLRYSRPMVGLVSRTAAAQWGQARKNCSEVACSTRIVLRKRTTREG